MSENMRAIVSRLSALPEDYVLRYFWLMVGQGADRLELLQHLSHVIIARPPTWNRAEIRAAHEAWTTTLTGRRFKPQCFACRADRFLFFHHVIEVQHGGSNDGNNLVGLCFQCHKRLHPWLQEPESHAHDFESARQVTHRLTRQFRKKARAS